MEGINTKLFKKWIIKNIGKKCSDYNWNCFVCRSHRLLEDLKGYEEYMELLDMPEKKDTCPKIKTVTPQIHENI
jgi:hypothetical protein